MNDNSREIPPDATLRQEFIRCVNPDCQNLHGPFSMRIGNKIRN